MICKLFLIDGYYGSSVPDPPPPLCSLFCYFLCNLQESKIDAFCKGLQFKSVMTDIVVCVHLLNFHFSFFNPSFKFQQSSQLISVTQRIIYCTAASKLMYHKLLCMLTSMNIPEWQSTLLNMMMAKIQNFFHMLG